MLSNKSQKLIRNVLTAAFVVGAVGVTTTIAVKKASSKSKSITLTVGKSKKITLNNKKQNCRYTYKSNNTKVAKVNKSGKIFACGKGTANIAVYEIVKGTNKANKVSVIKVTVNPAVYTYSSRMDSKPEVVPAHDSIMEPAYGTYYFDSFKLMKKHSISMDKLMKYGAKCEVRFKAKQNSGVGQILTIAYSGSMFKQGFDQNSSPYVGKSETVIIGSGTENEYCTVLTVEKYMLDCGIDFLCDAEVEISDISVSTRPFDNADYQKMINDSYISGGNNSRLKRVINKALSGQDVTLAYLGGSITEGCAATNESINSDCYAETSYNEFKMKYGAGDGSNVHFINAGMSGTPSSLGVIRYQNDVLAQMKYGKYPDVLFIEFVVNDGDDTTKGEAIESLIRQGLEQGSAVFLVFSHTVTFDTHRQEMYIPLGEKYDLPMVSVKNAITPYLDQDNLNDCDVSEWFFWGDRLHPATSGHRFMADMIMNVFDKAYGEEEVEDPITDIDSVEPVFGKAYTGMTMINSTLDINTVDAIEELSVGSFSDTDKEQCTFQYEKGGHKNVEWFPDCWMHKNGTDSFKATVKCSNMMIAYKLANDSDFGKAELYVDGVHKDTMDGYNSSGWNNASVSVVFNDDKTATHTFEIKMAQGDEDKKFTIYAIGYTNTEDYKESLKRLSV